MKVEELKNYGRSWPEVVSDPAFQSQLQRITVAIKKQLRSELGLIDLLRLMWHVRSELKRMRGHNWSSMHASGTSQAIIDSLMGPTAAVRALAAVVGTQRASDIYKRALDQHLYAVMADAFPSRDDFNACDADPFEVVKAYLRAMVEADARSGFHGAAVVDDTSTSFGYNITYCAQCRVAEEFGTKELCYPRNCYGDEVFIRKMLEGTGVEFSRSGTLAIGAKACDFRFKVVDAEQLLQISGRRKATVVNADVKLFHFCSRTTLAHSVNCVTPVLHRDWSGTGPNSDYRL